MQNHSAIVRPRLCTRSLLSLFALSTVASVFVTAQPLNVTSLRGAGYCTAVAPLTLTDCVPGEQLLISGQNLSQVTVIVGGADCIVRGTVFGSSYLPCILPALENFVPDQGYDVVLYQGSEVAVTLPAAVAFRQYPAVASITSQFCPANFAPIPSKAFNLQCDPGALLTVIGRFFSPSEQLAVLLSGSVISAAPCIDVHLLSSSALTCVLPALPRATGLSVQVIENATSSSNKLAAWIYRDPSLDPVLYSVSGCEGLDAQTRGAVGCVTGATITLTGANFTGGSIGASVDIFDVEAGVLYSCLSINVTSSTTIQCVLPYIPLQAQDGLVLPVRVHSASGTSNWLLAVGYLSSLTGPSTTEGLVSASYRIAFFVCVSLLCAVVVVLAAGACRQWRHKSWFAMGNPVRALTSEKEAIEVGNAHSQH